MKTCKRWKFAVTAATALSALPVLAQGPGGGQGFGQGGRMVSDSPNDPSTLLTAEAVQKEIALTDDQKASLQKLRDERAAAGQAFFAKFMGLSQDEMQKRMEERTKESRDAISKILAPKQMERLNEINFQVAGVTALGFEVVAEKIGLTADQKEKLKVLGDESRRRLAELSATYNGPQLDDQKRQERKKKLEEIRSQRKDKSVALLTEEQKAKFEQLQGDKFDTSTIHPTYESFGSRGRIDAPGRVPAR